MVGGGGGGRKKEKAEETELGFLTSCQTAQAYLWTETGRVDQQKGSYVQIKNYVIKRKHTQSISSLIC